MESTGIIRRVDSLGRIVLSKEIRRRFKITENTPMEIFTTSDGIVLKKYNTEEELLNIISVLSDFIDDSVDDLGGEKVFAIRQHIGKIRNILE